MLRAVAGLIPGGSKRHVLQANPALVRAAPLHTVGGGLLIDVDLGASGQRANLGGGNFGIAAYVQVGVAADHAGVDGDLRAASAAGAAIALAVHLDVVHVDPALIQVVVPLNPAPSCAACDLLGFINGNLGVLGNGSFEVGGCHARGRANIHLIRVHDLASLANQRGVILFGGISQVHISQIDPAVSAVEGNLAPATGTGSGVLILISQDLDNCTLCEGASRQRVAVGGGRLTDIQGGSRHGAGGQNGIAGQVLVLDILISHPAGDGLALGVRAGAVDPLDVPDDLLPGDLELAVGLQSTNLAGSQIRQTVYGGGSSLRGVNGVICSNLIGSVLPLGGQGQLGGGLVQNADRSFGTLLIIHQVPAQEAVAALGGLQGQGGGRRGAVSKNDQIVSKGISQAAAVAVKHNICITRRSSAGVNVVQVHIGLGQTAVQQAPEVVGAGIAAVVQADGIQEIVALLTVNNRAAENSVRGHPRGAAVVAEQGQGIVLVLGEGNVELLGKVIDRLVHSVLHMVFQQSGSFRLGDPVLIDIGIINLGTISDVMLPAMDISLGGEALELLQDFDRLVAGVQRRGCRSSEHSGGH